MSIESIIKQTHHYQALAGVPLTDPQVLRDELSADDRETVDVELHEDDVILLHRLAHEQNVTPNQLIVEVLLTEINRKENSNENQEAP